MKAVLSYLVVLVSAAFYMFLFDREAGGIMTVFLIVVPLISVILTIATRKKIQFDILSPEETLKKKSTEKISVLIRKNTIFPVPIVSFSFRTSEHFMKPEYDVYRFSMSENRELKIDIPIYPEICGAAEVTVCDMTITDYLGIFRFRLKFPPVSRTLCILPDVTELEDGGEILRSIYSTLPDNDDDDAVSAVIGKSAFPGYEYREYVPGDSLKKINWKLSSKKNQLFVRMDEASGMTLPDIVLDTSEFKADGNRRYAMYLQELITESALSMLVLCIRHGIECTFSYMKDGIKEKYFISSIDDIDRAADRICRIPFTQEGVLIGNSENTKSTDVSVIYTLDITDELAASAEDSILNGNCVKFIIPEQLTGKEIRMSDVWLLREDHTIYRIS